MRVYYCHNYHTLSPRGRTNWVKHGLMGHGRKATVAFDTQDTGPFVVDPRPRRAVHFTTAQRCEIARKAEEPMAMRTREFSQTHIGSKCGSILKVTSCALQCSD